MVLPKHGLGFPLYFKLWQKSKQAKPKPIRKQPGLVYRVKREKKKIETEERRKEGRGRTQLLLLFKEQD